MVVLQLLFRDHEPYFEKHVLFNIDDVDVHSVCHIY